MTESNPVTGNESAIDEQALQQALGTLKNIRRFINERVIGQPVVIDQVLMALLCNGHVLLEGVPGLGKTLLVRTLSSCFGGEYKRIQFTPDLMPADITGHVLFDMNESRFRVRKGPVFTNLLLADEINRAPAKTQAALLEVMQERQVTLEGKARALPKPFMVLATQNPIEQEGTYPLPEAQLDRFLFKVLLDYPNEASEVELTKLITQGVSGDSSLTDAVQSFLMPEQVSQLQALVTKVTVDAQVMEYAVRLVRATRHNTYFARGAGSRACIALVRAAKAHALMRASHFASPDDVKGMALAVLRHRVSLSAEMEMEGLDVDTVLMKVIDTVDAPRL
ncbi:MAG TPA: MoxR family ATPase [Marinagarivorans sp.]